MGTTPSPAVAHSPPTSPRINHISIVAVKNGEVNTRRSEVQTFFAHSGGICQHSIHNKRRSDWRRNISALNLKRGTSYLDLSSTSQRVGVIPHEGLLLHECVGRYKVQLLKGLHAIVRLTTHHHMNESLSYAFPCLVQIAFFFS